MLVCDFDVFGDHFHVLVEVFHKLLVLLISPRRAQGVQLCPQRSQPLFEFLVELLQVATLLDVRESIRQCRDPDDDKLLELAVTGNASCIVTGDQDLLALNPFRGIRIFTPDDFLNWLSAT